MNEQIRSAVFHLPKIIILGLALVNYLYIQAQVSIKTGPSISFCLICPWYETSDFNNVLIILLASIFLLIGKRWSYIAACVLSGYVVFVGLFYIVRSVANFSLSELWQFILEQEKIFLVWEVQVVLAGAVFCAAVLYLLQCVFAKKYLY
jgi:hypothetical protein